MIGEGARFRVIDRAAGAVVVIARLSDGTDGHKVLLSFVEMERIAGDIRGISGDEFERLGEMGMTDERDVGEGIVMGKKAHGLFQIEDVIEFFGIDRRAVADGETGGMVIGIREFLEPFHVFFFEEARVVIEDVSCGLVVVGIIHASTDGGVVIAEDRDFGEIADEVATFIGLGAISDDVSQTQIFVTRILLVEIENDL